jgi:hypothetical protein
MHEGDFKFIAEWIDPVRLRVKRSITVPCGINVSAAAQQQAVDAREDGTDMMRGLRWQDDGNPAGRLYGIKVGGSKSVSVKGSA